MGFPSQRAIVRRLRNRIPYDPYGFEVREYMRALDFEHAKEFLKPGVTEEDWTDQDIRNREDAIRVMRDYWMTALIKSGRPVSMLRAVMHYVAWAWLAGDKNLSDRLCKSPISSDSLLLVAYNYGFKYPLPESLQPHHQT